MEILRVKWVARTLKQIQICVQRRNYFSNSIFVACILCLECNEWRLDICWRSLLCTTNWSANQSSARSKCWNSRFLNRIVSSVRLNWVVGQTVTSWPYAGICGLVRKRLSQRLDEKLINASACNKLSQSTFLSRSEWARQDKWFAFCISAPWTLLFFQQSVVIIILSSCGGVIKAACGYTNSHIKDQLNNTIARGVSSVPPWLPVSVADKYNR